MEETAESAEEAAAREDAEAQKAAAAEKAEMAWEIVRLFRASSRTMKSASWQHRSGL
ncbi:hypothetical protein GCM10027402_10420 [Arthrobacter monumenti]